MGAANPKVLITDDDAPTRLLLRAALVRDGFGVLEADSGEEALACCQRERPSLVVLDIGLPGLDGLEVCRALRTLEPRVGILMLTTQGEDRDKIRGLDFGADDYMVKPFHPGEFLARVRAVLRRVPSGAEGGLPLEYQAIRVDPRTRKVHQGNSELKLTPREYKLLTLLLANQGRALSREEITTALWGANHFGSPKLLDVYVRRLREKIEDAPSDPQLIQTVRGFGYICP
nr:response regulator transcription factor [uncultured Holophaga sp.]